MKNTSLNILVTGAGGFIAFHLCKKLQQEGYEVFGFSLPNGNEKAKKLLGKRFFEGDIKDQKLINDILKGNKIQIVLHLAAKLPSENDLESPFSLFEVNDRGTLNLLNSAYLNGIKRFIYISTSSVYSVPPEYLPVDEKHPTKPSTFYGASKLAGEIYCNVYSKLMDITILRYCGAYGIGQDEHYATYRFVEQALNNNSITIYGNGAQTTNFTYIDDIVKGTVLAVENNVPGTYNISNGEETSIKELAKKIIELAGSKSKIVLSDKNTDRPFRFSLDIKKAKKVLGYSPMSLEEGLKRYLSNINKLNRNKR